jgi:receptor expression-enhancing protein 5/6
MLLGCAITVLLLVVLDVGSSFLSNLVGFVYPSYMSFKALQTSYSEDDRHWLTYWTVYSFVTLFDPFLEIIFSFIPMYHLFKLCFYVWLFNPKTQGAELIYQKAVKPFLN